MAETVLPPNPCLLAIILTTHKRDGTSEVFCYPPNPGSTRRRRRKRAASTVSTVSSSSSGSLSSSSSEGEDDFDDLTPSQSNHKYGSRSEDLTTAEKSNRPSQIRSGGSLSRGAGDSKAGGSHGGAAATSNTSNGSYSRGSGSFLGLPAGFHHFLQPPPSFNKRRFELTIDQLVFLGRPAYSREDGSWRKNKTDRHKSKKDKRTKQHGTSSVRAESVAKSVTSNGIDTGSKVKADRRKSVQLESLVDVSASSEAETDGQTNINAPVEELSGFEAGYGHEYEEVSKPASHSNKEILKMFNLVFVLNPPAIEYQRRVDDMYKYVVKRFAGALRYEQSRSDYVLKESEHIRHMKAKHSSIEHIVKHSPLAKAIAEVFNSISASRIAPIDLTPRTSFSVQLPLPTSIAVLPSLTEPQLPGVWLTTSNSIASADTLDVDPVRSRSHLVAHFALLLLVPPAVIIAEVTASNPTLAPKIAHYLHHSHATQSFAQVAQSSGIPLPEIQFLASHLIYWRKARAIPPLHHRDIYITSPNADMCRLRSASAQFTRAFQTLPSLPKMLSFLSAGPRPYSTFIPSKDHKQAYMEILAWLLQGGWVTQLRSYAWVRVPQEMRERARRIARVEERARAERQRKAEAEQAAAKLEQAKQRRGRRESSNDSRESGSGLGTDTDGENEESSSVHSSSTDTDGRVVDDPGEADLPSGYLTPMDASIYSTNSGDSAESARTTIPLRNKTPSHSHLFKVENASEGSGNGGSGGIGGGNVGEEMTSGSVLLGTARDADERDDYFVPEPPKTELEEQMEQDAVKRPAATLILSPARASGIEMRYLAAIAAQMEEEDGRDAREAWDTCLKYFNGEHALEKISVREGFKRKKLEALRARWRSRGVLLEVRHW